MMSQTILVPEREKVLLVEQTLGPPGRGQVTIEAECSALSPGTERFILLGHQFEPPHSIGYSLIGRIMAIGTGVTRFKVGDHVVAVAPHASHVNVDERAVLPAPAGIDPEQAAFFVLAHTALYGIRQSRLQFGEPVAVIGQGIVGLLAGRLAVLGGGLPVIAIDIDERRLQISRALGIHEAFHGGDPQLSAFVKGLPGGGVPVVIEVTGARAPVEQALDLVSVRGRIVLLGSTDGEETVPFHAPLSMKGASLIGAYVNSKPWTLLQTDMQITRWPPSLAPGTIPYSGADVFTSADDIRIILELIRYGMLNIRPLITDRIRPSEVPAAYQRVVQRDSTLVGAVIRWQ